MGKFGAQGGCNGGVWRLKAAENLFQVLRLCRAAVCRHKLPVRLPLLAKPVCYDSRPQNRTAEPGGLLEAASEVATIEKTIAVHALQEGTH